MPGGGAAGVLVAGTLFSEGELCAMRLDGVARGVCAGVYRSVTIAETPALRAAALLRKVPPALVPRVAIGRLAAAWVYGCAPPPERIALVVANARRTTELPPFSGCTLHEVALADADVTAVGDASVTTGLRTAMDIALYVPAPAAAPVLRRLDAAAWLDAPLHRVRTEIARVPGLPWKLRALALLEQLMEGG